MRVKYKDIFNLVDFYKALRYWLEEYNWTAEDDSGKTDGDFYETLYLEKIGTDGSKEIRFEWRLSRNSPSSGSIGSGQAVKQYLDLNFQCYGVSNTEVIRDGIKYKANKGEVEVKMNAYIEKSFESTFEKHPILKHFITLFNREIYDWREREKELYQEVYVLQNFIKQWFKLKRYLPYEEAKAFHESRAWPSHHKED